MAYEYGFSLTSFKNFIDSALSNIMTKFLVGTLIILIGFIVGKLLGKIIEKILAELELNKIVKKISGVSISLEHIISSFTSYFIFFLSIIMALNQIGITTDVLNILSAAVMILIVLSVFLGIKDFVPNFIAGLHISQKEMFKVGDTIKFKEIRGKVVQINLVDTVVSTQSDDLIYIPNLNLIKHEVIVVKTFGSKLKDVEENIKKAFKQKKEPTTSNN
ncbi:mechanosensitive ion channel [Candidatus Woesearchaeota archaeon]|nr:mechanosensitive ion channel [Candidatus Woesearchaeota archaeon]